MVKQKSRRADLKKLFVALQGELLAKLKANRVIDHPGSKGESTEIDWVAMLEAHLPARYRVGPAFVIDADGRMSEQIDLVIYDRQYCPILFTRNGKHYIPAEAVYAVFEIKQVLNRKHILYAGKKIASVRNLRRTSGPIPSAAGIIPAREQFPILGGLLTLSTGWSPAFGSALKKCLKTLTTSQRLDLGCVLEEGSYRVEYETREPTLDVGGKEIALIKFFLSLVSLLQSKATAPAIDWSEYNRAIK